MGPDPKVHDNKFKTVLDEIEAGGRDLFPSGSGHIRALNQFKSLSASVVYQPASQRSDRKANRTWSAKAFKEHTDWAHDRCAAPAVDHGNLPLTLTQLQESLRFGLSIKELGRLRRRFAFENHPDRAPANKRDMSARKLSIANDLIDRAIRDTCR